MAETVAEIEDDTMVDRRAEPGFTKWLIPTACVMLGAALTIGTNIMSFQMRSNYDDHATSSSSQAEIAALQDRERAIETQLAGLPTIYVSQNAFTEFKARYEKDQAEEHDFRVRIDSKMDMLLADRGVKMSKPKTAFDEDPRSMARDFMPSEHAFTTLPHN